MSESANGHRKYVSVKTIGKRMERIIIQYESNPPPAYDEESGASSEAVNNQPTRYSTNTGLENMPHIVEYAANTVRKTDNNRNNRRKRDRYKARSNGREQQSRDSEQPPKDGEQRSTERQQQPTDIEQPSNDKEEASNDKESSDQNGTKIIKNQTNQICTAHVRDSDTENDAPFGKNNMTNRKRRSSIRSN